VLIGEFDTAHLMRGGGPAAPTDAADPPAEPEPSRWVLFTYTADREVNVFGCGPRKSDGTARPGLQPLEL
jgi:hypothetical protein